MYVQKNHTLFIKVGVSCLTIRLNDSMLELTLFYFNYVKVF